MRNMSFALTTAQLMAGTKTVTRRIGWRHLKPGDRVMAVQKSQGLKKGEKIKPLCIIRVVSVRREPLSAIRDSGDGYADTEMAAEGFAEWFPESFVCMFCAANRCAPDTEITRIEFEKVEP